jgi:saccharopine dehydrogenase-like NADP-dependent oxidoreductase
MCFIVKQILVLGAGQSASFLVARLLEDGEREDWFVTVGDLDLELARQRAGDHRRGDAVRFDVNDAESRSKLIDQADVVINMLPAAFQDLVAWDCVNHGRHLLSVSYRDQTMRDLDLDAKRKGIVLLFEMGLDPGIDHMSAMSLISTLRADGGRIVGFCSYGSGIPAPGQSLNPLRYVITWDPRNVVMAGFEGAQYMENGNIKIVPFHQVFHHTWPVEVDGVGPLEAYANRDSMSYMQSFGLKDVHTMIRGTLRYPGWSETWSQIVRLGLPNETLRIPNLADRTYAEVVEMFLPLNASGTPLAQRIASFLGISPTGQILQNLHWLGLLSDERIGCVGDTAAAMLIHMLSTRIPLTPDLQDMVVLVHELEVEYPEQDRSPERVRSTLVVKGELGGYSAMSTTVGLPVAIAAKLLLRGELPLTGSLIPTDPSVYLPILEEIEASGLRFVESRHPLAVA